MKKALYRRAETRARYRHALAIDTETEGKTGKFILGAIYGKYRNHHGKEITVDEVFYSEKDLVAYIEKIETAVGKSHALALVMHNAAFDTRYIERLIDWNTAIYSGSRLITARTLKGSRIYDTGNFLSGSLEYLIKQFNLEAEGIYKLSFDNLEERCRNDARATWRLFDIIQRFFINEFNQSIRYTLPSTALEIYRRNYFNDVWIRENCEDIDDFERQAYYGGRVEVFKRGEHLHTSYDVNSMYPAVMSTELLPKPNSAYWEYNPTQETVYKRLEQKRLFVLEATVIIPMQYIPPLPVRHNGKLVFPVGEVRGVWCSPEISAALRYGVTIKEVHRMLTYTRADRYLSGYANDIYRRRVQAAREGNEAMKYMFKILLNALYGKFGERWGQSRNYVPLEQAGDIDLNGRTIVFDEAGREYLVIEPEEKRDSPHTFPCISAFITAYARVRLLDGMKAVGEHRVIYCDTDSIKVQGTEPVNLEVNPEKLGAWKNEGSGVAAFYRPKLYGKKIKGVPKRHSVIECTPEYIRVAFEQVIKRKESFRRNLPQNAFIPAEKVISLVDDKREWRGNESTPINLL